VSGAVVTGASGLLGGAVARDLAARRAGVEAWSHAVASVPDGLPLRRLDLRLEGEAERALRASRPELVVHCAALTDVDACERDPAAAALLNAEVPGRLAAAAAAVGARFVHVSTDAVYDGEAPGARSEDDAPAPVNAYARSKLAGESAVVGAHPGAVVVRTTMHGWTARGRLSFSEAILRALVAGRRLTLFADVIFSPLNVVDLAALLRAVAERDVSGVVNAGAADAVDKETFGRLVARAFQLPEDPIEPIAVADLGLRAPRPRRLPLDVRRITALLGAPPPTVEDGLRRLREEAESGAAARLKGRPRGDLRALLENDA
jgi:dTDP-4-dehydrorhamnose reductase